jgi:phospholipase D1/2
MFDRGSHSGGGHFRQKLYSKFDEFGHQSEPYQGHPQSHAEHSAQRGGSDCQITRSSAKWSHNLAKTEVSKII